jgi:hypothetical protein
MKPADAPLNKRASLFKQTEPPHTAKSTTHTPMRTNKGYPGTNTSGCTSNSTVPTLVLTGTSRRSTTTSIKMISMVMVATAPTMLVTAASKAIIVPMGTPVTIAVTAIGATAGFAIIGTIHTGATEV